jgi:GNAT superfamily N-acetyltransferase
MKEIGSIEALTAVTADPLLHWAAQGFRGGVRAWTAGCAVGVAVEDVAIRHRLAVTGPAQDAALAVAMLMASDGPRYRPIGDEALISSLCRLLPGLTPTPSFGWMHTSGAPDPDARVEVASRQDVASVSALLDQAFPGSLARPGIPGVTRWWVLRERGEIAACAADAWSAPGVGLLAGVASAPQARGRGLARAVVSTALAALVGDYGSAALMVESDNVAARGLYGSLGLSYRELRAAAPD